MANPGALPQLREELTNFSKALCLFSVGISQASLTTQCIAAHKFLDTESSNSVGCWRSGAGMWLVIHTCLRARRSLSGHSPQHGRQLASPGAAIEIRVTKLGRGVFVVFSSWTGSKSSVSSLTQQPGMRRPGLAPTEQRTQLCL